MSTSPRTRRPALNVTVVAGATVSAPFGLRPGGDVRHDLRAGSPAGTQFATNAETSFVNTYGTSYVSGTPAHGVVVPLGRRICPDRRALHRAHPALRRVPFGRPLGVAGGHHRDQRWSGSGGRRPRRGRRRPVPGAAASMTVQHGALTVRSNKAGTLTVASASADRSQLGRSRLRNLDELQLHNISANTDTTIALPFGTWTVTVTPSFGGLPVSLSRRSTTSRPGLVSGTTVMLDPRPAA